MKFIHKNFVHYLLHSEVIDIKDMVDMVLIDLTLQTWEHLFIVKYLVVSIENIKKEVME